MKNAQFIFPQVLKVISSSADTPVKSQSDFLQSWGALPEPVFLLTVAIFLAGPELIAALLREDMLN